MIIETRERGKEIYYNWAREYPDFGRLSCVALADAKHCDVFTRKSSKAGVEGERVSRSPRRCIRGSSAYRRPRKKQTLESPGR